MPLKLVEQFRELDHLQGKSASSRDKRFIVVRLPGSSS